MHIAIILHRGKMLITLAKYMMPLRRKIPSEHLKRFAKLWIRSKDCSELVARLSVLVYADCTMNIREYLGSKIPRLTRKTEVTDADIMAVQTTGPIHRWLVGADMAWGAFGSATPATTISGRVAHDAEVAQRVSNGPWYAACPIWVLILGAALEIRWAIPFVSYPGHLQDAMNADVSRQVGGLLYHTGIRVLVPQEK
jgi:hypothetical protein